MTALSSVLSPIGFDSLHPKKDLGSTPPGGPGFAVLRDALRRYLLDSSSGYVDAADTDWWPGQADSTSIAPPTESRASGAASLRLMSTADQIALVVHTLGFSKRQLADLFGVSRQAIYDWLKGGNVSAENARKLSALAELLSEVTTGTRRPLYQGFTAQPLGPGEPSILELLRNDSWDRDRILALLHRARDLTTNRNERQGTSRNKRDQGRLDDNLSDNLLALGEE